MDTYQYDEHRDVCYERRDAGVTAILVLPCHGDLRVNTMETETHQVISLLKFQHNVLVLLFTPFV